MNTTSNPIPTLLQAFDADNERFRRRVGRDRSVRTYNIKVRAREFVSLFLAYRQQSDIELSSLTPDFISDFSAFLSTERRLRDGTIWLACTALKGVVMRAWQRGWLTANPFVEFHQPKNIRERQYLTIEELRQLMSCRYRSAAVAYARDVFVFSALTGISFVDIQRLRPTDLVSREGQIWIEAVRQKTRKPYRVRLLPQALDIIHRQLSPDRPFIFARYGYHSVLIRLRQALLESGIHKHITLHCARHSFAVLALNNGMPIESVSRILGHSRIATTQIYARVTNQKLEADFVRLEGRLLPQLSPSVSLLTRMRSRLHHLAHRLVALW